MSGLNKVQVIGNLGKDPEVKYTASGKAVCNFSVAVNETWKDKDGAKQERVEWFRVAAWDKLAELCGEYLSKGRQVYVEGRLQTREYEKDGQKHYATDLVATNVVFLSDGKGKRDEGPPQGLGGVPLEKAEDGQPF